MSKNIYEYDSKTNIELSGDEVRLPDFSDLKIAMIVMAIIFACLTIVPLLVPDAPKLVAFIFGLLTVFAIAVGVSEESSFVVDKKNKEISFEQCIFGWRRRSIVCQLDDVVLVAASGVHYSTARGDQGHYGGWCWRYCPLLVTSDGMTTEIPQQPDSPLELANRNAKIMAKYLGVRFVAGEDERVLQVERDGHEKS